MLLVKLLIVGTFQLVCASQQVLARCVPTDCVRLLNGRNFRFAVEAGSNSAPNREFRCNLLCAWCPQETPESACEVLPSANLLFASGIKVRAGSLGGSA